MISHTNPDPFKIFYENQHLIIVDKAPLSLSVPSRHEKQDPRPCLGRSLEKILGIRLYPTHRLDYEVSGLIIFAKTAEAHKRLNYGFENHQILKTYLALSSATKPAPEMLKCLEWESTILRGKKRSFESPHGKKAITQARCLRSQKIGPLEVLLWELHPKTGRPHQLRFEMTKHGYPILGDQLYASQEKWVEGIALEAVCLEFSKFEYREKLQLPTLFKTSFSRLLRAKYD